MATFYVLSARREELFDWAARSGPPSPRGPAVDPDVDSRLPTVAEIKRVLKTIATHESKYLPNPDRRGMDIEVNSRRDQGTSTCVLITHKSDGNTIEDLTFHESDSELAVEIVKQLTFLCGPLVLIEAGSTSPCVVHTQTDVADTVTDWLRS